MATTKAKLAEQVLRIIQGGSISDDSDIDTREIILHIEQERDRLIKQMILLNFKMGEHEINGNYLSSYQENVFNDTERGKKYVKVQYMPIDLPNDGGFFSLSVYGNETKSFIRNSANSLSLYDGLGAENNIGRMSYYIEGSKAYLNNSPNGVTKLLWRLVVSSKDIEDDEPFPVCADMESEIIKSVIQLYTIMDNIEQDNRNDLIDNK